MSTNRLLRLRALPPAVIALGLMLLPAQANAGHGQQGIDPDNTNQSINKHSLSSRGNDAVNWGDAELEQSVINTSWTTGDADIGIYDNDYDQNSWLGEVYCTDWNHNIFGFPTTCDDMTILLDSENLDPYSLTVWKHVACQELGHSGDLGHRAASNDSNDNSCMRDDILYPVGLDTHDIDAIAETF